MRTSISKAGARKADKTAIPKKSKAPRSKSLPKAQDAAKKPKVVYPTISPQQQSQSKAKYEATLDELAETLSSCRMIPLARKTPNLNSIKELKRLAAQHVSRTSLAHSHLLNLESRFWDNFNKLQSDVQERITQQKASIPHQISSVIATIQKRLSKANVAASYRAEFTKFQSEFNDFVQTSDNSQISKLIKKSKSLATNSLDISLQVGRVTQALSDFREIISAEASISYVFAHARTNLEEVVPSAPKIETYQKISENIEMEAQIAELGEKKMALEEKLKSIKADLVAKENSSKESIEALRKEIQSLKPKESADSEEELKEENSRLRASLEEIKRKIERSERRLERDRASQRYLEALLPEDVSKEYRENFSIQSKLIAESKAIPETTEKALRLSVISQKGMQLNELNFEKGAKSPGLLEENGKMKKRYSELKEKFEKLRETLTNLRNDATFSDELARLRSKLKSAEEMAAEEQNRAQLAALANANNRGNYASSNDAFSTELDELQSRNLQISRWENGMNSAILSARADTMTNQLQIKILSQRIEDPSLDIDESLNSELEKLAEEGKFLEEIKKSSIVSLESINSAMGLPQTDDPTIETLLQNISDEAFKIEASS